MNKTYTKIKHPKGFFYTFVPLNNNLIFNRKKGVWINPDRFGRTYDYGVYVVIDESKNEWTILPYTPFPIKGKIVYIGRGVINSSKLLKSRAVNHDRDMLSNSLNKNHCIFMFGCGMSYEESSVLEAFWIANSGIELSKRGQKQWDGNKAINKRKERRWEKEISNILQPYGNNTRLTA